MAARVSVLVVDDDEAILDLVRMALEFEGYEVVVAGSGRQALDLLASASPALILLDVQMPDLNGWEFARAYMKGRASRAPILVMTAGQNGAEVAQEVGAEGHIGKPFDLEELLEAVRLHTGNGTK